MKNENIGFNDISTLNFNFSKTLFTSLFVGAESQKIDEIPATYSPKFCKENPQITAARVEPAQRSAAAPSNAATGTSAKH